MAQDAPAYLWINSMKAKPGQGDALIKLIIEENAKHFDPLVDRGAAHGWGLAMPIVHDGNDPYSHIEWVVFNGWAGADTFFNAYSHICRTSPPRSRASGTAPASSLRPPTPSVPE